MSPGATTPAATPAVRPRGYGPLLDWFGERGWRAAPFQREAWRRYLRGESGLLVTPTGSGKTLAFSLPMVTRLVGGARRARQPRQPEHHCCPPREEHRA